jgi:hypothetical protein
MIVYCKRCEVSLRVPEFARADQNAIVSLVRSGRHGEAIRMMRDLHGLDLHDAKAVEMHITRTPGECVRCRRRLASTGQTECANCRSLALDW